MSVFPAIFSCPLILASAPTSFTVLSHSRCFPPDNPTLESWGKEDAKFSTFITVLGQFGCVESRHIYSVESTTSSAFAVSLHCLGSCERHLHQHCLLTLRTCHLAGTCSHWPKGDFPFTCVRWITIFSDILPGVMQYPPDLIRNVTTLLFPPIIRWRPVLRVKHGDLLAHFGTAHELPFLS